MIFHKTLMALAATIALSYCMDCTGKPDGVYELACKSYTVCAGGVKTLKNCAGDQVYNSLHKRCDSPDVVPPPCGRTVDCTVILDGKYPDKPCHSYFVCAGGHFFGRHFCPTGTVFNALYQICDWPDKVLPPCGTKAR